MKSFTQWLEDLQDLYKKTIEFAPGTEKRQNIADEVKQPKVVITPDQENKELRVKAKIEGSKGEIYDTWIFFQNIKFNPDLKQMTFGHFMLIDPKTNEKIYFEKPVITGTNVKVKCTCPDFIFNFSQTNKEQGALIGTSVPTSKRNPLKFPGMCKHLFRLKNYLHDRNLLGSESW